MSFWIYGKDKDGKRTVKSVTIPPEIIITLLALLSALIVPYLLLNDVGKILTSSFYLIATGFVMFAFAKVIQFQKGAWISWGMKLMPLPGKILYVLGYVLMTIGILIIIALYKNNI